MYNLFVEILDKSIVLRDKLTIINIENPLIFRDLYYNFNDRIVISLDNDIISSNKYLVIDDLLNLNLNSKKNITSLYKYLESFSDEEDFYDLSVIESTSLKMINHLCSNTNLDVDCDSNISIVKLLSLFDVSLSDDYKGNFVSYLINFIRTIHEIVNVNLIITYNLSNYLSEEELSVLSYELSLYDLWIVDISLNKNSDAISAKIVVDNDGCII